MDKILLLGDPRLRVVCEPVTDFGAPGYRGEARRLAAALERFRAEHGFGRAISAPQIGIPKRMIALNLGEGPFLIVNPILTTLDEESFTLWDDCMSFPWLMVRLQRHLRVKLGFCDEEGRPQEWDSVDRAVSELLQHEIDHLDGILAVDRAIDRRSIIARDVYLERRQFFDSQVDYAIQPTILA
jgi:peptide deformylase